MSGWRSIDDVFAATEERLEHELVESSERAKARAREEARRGRERDETLRDVPIEEAEFRVDWGWRSPPRANSRQDGLFHADGRRVRHGYNLTVCGLLVTEKWQRRRTLERIECHRCAKVLALEDREKRRR